MGENDDDYDVAADENLEKSFFLSTYEYVVNGQ